MDKTTRTCATNLHHVDDIGPGYGHRFPAAVRIRGIQFPFPVVSSRALLPQSGTEIKRDTSEREIQISVFY